MPLDNTGRKPAKSNIVTAKPPRAKRLKIPPLTEAELAASSKPEVIRITKPRLRTAAIKIVGISPYCQHAFSEKQRNAMEETQRAGQQARGKRKRDPKDFEAQYEAAKHYAKVANGQKPWIGIPAPAFRNACIDACRLVGYRMTHAKLSIFIEADGIDKSDGTPLVRIVGEPRIHKGFVRLATGVADICWRPFWEEWSATVNVQWDEDQFSAGDVLNLLLRAGLQVGIGEGRPNSPNSNGLGWGRFQIKEG